jgi:glycosyltransferase involved in cell wall biosynthesis
MLVSVIVPTLNEAANIRATLQAARHVHTLAQVEILVSDGRSIDNTLSLLPDDVVWVRSPRGRGVQMNRAAESARGDILLLLISFIAPPMWALPIESAIPGIVYRKNTKHDSRSEAGPDATVISNNQVR